MYLSITGVTPDNKVSKYQECKTEAEATIHAEEYGGFVVVDPGGNQNFWIVDMVEKTVTVDTASQEVSEAKEDSFREICRLEGDITLRRQRASDTDEDPDEGNDMLGGVGWLDRQYGRIETERAKL